MSQNRTEITCSKCGGKKRPLAEYKKTAEFTEGDRNQPICMPCYQKDRNSSPKVTRMKRVNLISRAQINLESVFLAVEDPDKPLIQGMQDELESLVHRLSAKPQVEEDRNAAVDKAVAAEGPDPDNPLPPPTELSNIQHGDYFVSKTAVQGDHALLLCCITRKPNGNVMAQPWTGTDWKPAIVVPSAAIVTPISPEDAKRLYSCFNRPPGVTASKETATPKSQTAKV